MCSSPVWQSLGYHYVITIVCLLVFILLYDLLNSTVELRSLFQWPLLQSCTWFQCFTNGLSKEIHKQRLSILIWQTFNIRGLTKTNLKNTLYFLCKVIRIFYLLPNILVWCIFHDDDHFPLWLCLLNNTT